MDTLPLFTYLKFLELYRVVHSITRTTVQSITLKRAWMDAMQRCDSIHKLDFRSFAQPAHNIKWILLSLFHGTSTSATFSHRYHVTNEEKWNNICDCEIVFFLLGKNFLLKKCTNPMSFCCWANEYKIPLHLSDREQKSRKKMINVTSLRLNAAIIIKLIRKCSAVLTLYPSTHFVRCVCRRWWRCHITLSS